jgi:hypothetical protein
MLKEEFVIDRVGCVVDQVLGVAEVGKERMKKLGAW